MFKPKNIYSVLKPAFYATKIIGYSPFSLNEDKYDKPSYIDLLWSISLMIFFGSMAFFSLTTRDSDSALITKVTDYLHAHLNVVSLCGGICFACIYARKITKQIQRICVFDTELKLIGLNFDMKDKYKREQKYITISVIAIWTYILALFALDIAAFTHLNFISIGQIFAYVGPILTTFIEFQFCTLVLLLRERFVWLNNAISELGNKHSNSNLFKKNKKITVSSKISPSFISILPPHNSKQQILAVVQKISIHHHDLCSISRKINEAYSFQILLIIIQAFMTIIAVSFYSIKLSFANALKLIPMVQRIYYLNMLFLNILLILALTTVCSITSKEAQNTGIILHDVIGLNVFVNVGYVDLGVTCFSLQLLHHNVQFTACKLFPLDETLLYSIVGAVTTYLVIVLQFELGVGKDIDKQHQNLNSTIK